MHGNRWDKQIPELRKCKHCGKESEMRGHQMYCSAECRNLSYGAPREKSPKGPVVLNNFTKEEIGAMLVEIELKKGKSARACECCGKTIEMRSDQKYCSASCRVKAHNQRFEDLYYMLLKEHQRALEERDEFVREISALNQRIKALEGSK